MSTQKDKFKLFERLSALGFTYEESAALRRIEMTLRRWAEQECGDGNDNGSWAIERDEQTEHPFMVHHHYFHGRGKDYTSRHPIADREAGALKRLAAIVTARNGRSRRGDRVFPYHQGDCRGASLYIVRSCDLREGEKLEQVYTRGLAVCC